MLPNIFNGWRHWTVAAGDPVLEGYPNDYSQVLLNILTNAKDAFLSRDVAEPKIVIRVDAEGDKSVVTITDNAGQTEYD